MAAPPASITNVVSVAAGSRHNLVLKNDGTVAAWGDNSYAQNSIPTNLSGVVAIEEKLGQSFAVKADRTAVSWGYNGNGLYQMPAGLTNVASIAAGGWHALALKTDGRVIAWGFNDYAQTNVPAGLSNVVAVAAGGHHSLALKTDGTVVGWGYDGSGTIVVPEGLSNVVAIAAGDAHCLALKTDGTVEAWGFNEYGQTDVPADLTNVVGIAAGEAHSLALKGDGTVVAWGDTGYGQADVPAGLVNVAAVAAGRYHSVALQADGPPFILTPRVNRSAVQGGTVLLRVAATGSLPLNYQWQLKGNPIAGATNAVLALADAQAGHAGAYSVVVSNAHGIATRLIADLTVRSRVTILASYDVCSNFSATANPGGVWSYGCSTTLGGSFKLLSYAGTSTLDNGVAAAKWLLAFNTLPAVYHNGTSTTGSSVYGQAVLPPGTVWSYAGGPGQAEQFVVIRFTVPTAGGGQYQVVNWVNPFADGFYQGACEYHVLKSGTELFGKALPAGAGTGYTNLLNLTDGDTVDFVVGRGSCAADRMPSLKIQAKLDKIGMESPPSIVAQPQDQTAEQGTTTSLKVIASGSAPLTYQWFFNSDPVAWGTGSTLILTNVQTSQAGSYRVVVSNSLGIVGSATAVLTVTPAVPKIQVYDIAKDFSASFNPAGVWSCGYATTLGGEFKLLTYGGTSVLDNGVVADKWLLARDTVPAVYHNGTSLTGFSLYGQAVLPPGTIWVVAGTPGQSEQFAVIRFTVPVGGAGSYRVETAVSPEANGSWQGASEYHVRGGGIELAGAALPPGAVTGYTNTLSLADGETVDFVVGRGNCASDKLPGLKVQARLTMLSTNQVGPSIVTEPQSQTVETGTTVNLSVSALGSAPLAYQWFFNSVPIESETGPTLVLTNVQASQAGSYSVVVSNSVGSVQSATAVLTVTPAVTKLAVYDVTRDFSASSNPGGVWRFGFQRTLGGEFSLLTYRGTSTLDNGVVADKWLLAHDTVPAVYHNGTTVTGYSLYGQATLPPGTIWVNPGLSGQAEQFTVLRFTVPADGAGHYLVETEVGPLANGSWQGASEYHVRKGGIELAGTALPAGAFTGYTNILVLGDGETVDFLVGRSTCPSDKVSGLKVQARLTLISTNPVGPSIVMEPQSQTVESGTTASFSVSASGSAPLAYQWLLNGAPLGWGTGPSLVLTNVQVSQAGNYSVVVSNVVGVVESAVAVLTVTPAVPKPVLYDIARDFSASSNPGGVWSCGYAATLDGQFGLLTFQGTSTLDNGVVADKWLLARDTVPAVYHNGTSATGLSLFGEAVLPPGTIWVNAGLPGQTEQFAVIRFKVPVGGAGQYLVETSVTPEANGSWQGASEYHVRKGGFELAGAALPAGAVTGYTNLLSLADGETVDFMVGRGTCPSDKVAGLQVQARLIMQSTNPVAPIILTQPASQNVAAGDSLSFRVEAVGTAPLAYQWWFNGSTLEGAVGATLTLEGVQVSQAGDYFVVVANEVGSVTSVVASLLVEQLPPVITAQPSSVVVTQGASLSFSVVAAGSQPLAYQWLFNGWPVPDATNATFSLEDVQEGRLGTYAVRVSNSVGALESNPATLTFAPSFEAATVSFSTLGGILTNRSYVVDLDGATRLAGSNYLVQFYAGLSADALAPIGMAVAFLDGSSAGLFNGGIRYLAGVKSGTLVLAQVRAWEQAAGPTFEAALASGGKVGASMVFAQSTGGGLNIPARLAMPSFSLGSMPGAVAPQIATQPQSQSVLAGSSAIFEVQADGSQPLHYQWLKGQFPLAGATNFSLVISNAQAADAGDYGVVVTNLFGAVTSQVATLTLAVQQVLSVVSPPDAPQASQISVPLELSSEGNVAGMTFVLRFNPDYLAEPEIVWSAALDGAFKEANTGVPGELRMVFVSPGHAIAGGTQTVATVRFYARATPENVTAGLDLELVDVSDANGDPIVRGTAVRDGNVRILGGSVALGDNNANGGLDVGDASLLLRMLARIDTIRSWDVPGGDLNQSGALDSGDAVKILRVAAGLDTPVSGGGGSASLRRAAKSAPSPSPLAFLTPSRARAGAGDVVTFQIALQDLAVPVSGAAFTLQYPSTALRLAGPDAHRLGGMVPAGAASVWNLSPDQNNYATQDGQISLAVSTASAWPDRQGVLAEFTFQVMPAASNQCVWPLLLTRAQVTASGYRTIPSTDTQAFFSARDPKPGSISTLRRAQSGAFEFSFTGESGGDYILEYSADLRDWYRLTDLLNCNGPVLISDPEAASAANRFYRVRPAH